jgi:hypothetical protein
MLGRALFTAFAATIFSLQPRADESITVFPTCYASGCLPTAASTSRPDAIPTGPAGKVQACLNDPNCVGADCSLRQSCFCGLKSPLACAWSCSWWNWFLAEDWYNQTACPGKTRELDFGGVPKCARQCLHDGLVDYGCISAGKDCFCLQGTLFDCDKRCSGAELESLQNWWDETCVDVDESGNQREVVRPDAGQKEALDWYEIFSITVFFFTTLILLLFWGLHHQLHICDQEER